MNPRIWIVGGSSGIGLELVKLLLKAHYRVIASSRKASKSDELVSLATHYHENLKLLDLDVTDKSDIARKSLQAFKLYDGVDIWFYNAGAYEVMGIDEWKIEHFEAMNEVNYLGAIRIMNALAEPFRKQGSGRWIWNLSLSSYFGLPLGGGYSAPKAALLNLAESLQPELLQHNIALQVINHGFVKTRLTAKNRFEMPQLMEPEDAAEQIFHAIESPYRFEIHFPFKLSFFLALLRYLPYRLSLALSKKMLP